MFNLMVKNDSFSAPNLSRLSNLCLLAGLLLLSACSSVSEVNEVEPKLEKIGERGKYTAADGKEFRYDSFEGTDREPELVIIGVHGINGASDDWHVLGHAIEKSQEPYRLYSYDLRGMGRDPIAEDRGDLRNANDWVSDLVNFTRLIEGKHPGAKLVWFGESLGSLIVMKAVSELKDSGTPLPVDALGLSAPIAGFGDKLSKPKEFALRFMALLFPKWRISLESLSDEEDVEVVEGVIHEQQAKQNEWHVERHTLRLLVKIGNEVKAMQDRAKLIKLPCLVMHGGQDVFTSPEVVRSFFETIPDQTPKEFNFYPAGYHLLFYGKNNEVICRDVLKWLDQL